MAVTHADSPDLTVGQLIESVHEQFSAADLCYGHGTDNAWDEAVALVLHVSGVRDHQDDLALRVSKAVVTDVHDLALRRLQGRIPLPYLLGVAPYAGYTFKIRQGVIVPRSPIGHLLQHGLGPWLPQQVKHILDLCAGCGALGIVAAHSFPDSTVTLLDIEPKACELAHDNVQRHGLQGRVNIEQRDVTSNLRDLGRFDLILANPPYVDAPDMRVLPPEYLAEPTLALAGGDDGLAVIEPIMAQIGDLLTEDGVFVGEVGASAAAFARKFSTIPLLWPDLPSGGEGVFVLEAQALNSHTRLR